ncbi:MAG: serine/threonine protein kinase [Thermoleophilaceae bacterium]|nr:serine/threonine protein kinase [Thermoleophilaceae bacterium]
MKRFETSVGEEPSTLPLGSCDPSEGPPGAAGSRLALGRYRLDRPLGAGGFGVVWLGWDERLEREVAVKAIPNEGQAGQRVEREARAAARLNHPGIVGIYELASDAHDVYLVSELVRGRTLAELERAGAISDRDVARIGVALCDALEHAHARGVIHRDVKPQNVMVVADPAAGAGFAKLTDFGVAHIRAGETLTRTGDVVGTLAYMPPEQADGERVTPACDVYSLGLTLYEAWTGTNPVRANGPAATARRLGRPLPSLAAARRDLSLELCDGIDAALDSDPARRPTLGRLRAALRAAESELADEGGLAEPATRRRVGLPKTEQRGLLRRRRVAVPAGVAGSEDPYPAPAAPLRLLQRIGAGALGGALVLAALNALGPEPPFSSPAAAGLAALAISLMPRIGWLLGVAGVCLWLASPEAGRQGTALVVAAAAAPVPFLLPRAGLLWSLPVLAPLLGTIALAPAFLGVAALAGTSWRRTGLAAAGLLWIAVAEALTGEALLFGSPTGTLPRGAWEGSVTGAASSALEPLLTTPALVLLAVWAAFAATLPLAIHGRWITLDLIGAGLWTAGFITAHFAVGDMLAGDVPLEQARGAVAGAVGAALVAFSVSRVSAPAQGWRAPRVTTA